MTARPTQFSPETLALHDAVDAAIRRTKHPHLHPEGAAVTTDLLGGEAMRTWQEDKAARVLEGARAWSDLPQIYGRYGTEASRSLIQAVAGLEGAAGAVLTDSGMQALALAVDVSLGPKDHVLVSRQVYNKTKGYLMWLSERTGIEPQLLDEVTPAVLRDRVQPSTALVIAETYSNPLLRALDPEAVGAEVVALRQRAPKLRLLIDNTVATPWGTKRPLLDWPGIDAVAAAGTKALGGQDRDLLGYVASRDVAWLNRVMDLQAMRGGVLGWRTAQAVLEGLPAAQQRFEKRCASATTLAAALAQHAAVEIVHHPSLATHPDRQLIDKHYRLPGSLVSFKLRGLDEEATSHFCDVLATTRIIRYALSFDGLVTKVNHHKTVSEFHTPDGALRKQGIDRMVRLAVGTEHADDILACCNWALSQHAAVSTEEVLAWQRQRRIELGL